MTDLKQTLKDDAAEAESYFKSEETSFLAKLWSTKTLGIVAAASFVLGFIVAKL